jgi:hypothetical protein
MFGQSLTLGAVVYAAPLNGAFEFTPMVGGSQSQPQGQTQLNGFHYGNGTFHIWKNGRVRPVPHQVRPRRAGWPLRRNNRENDRHYARQGLHPNQLSHYKGRAADCEWQWRRDDHKLVTALYSQTFCKVHNSLFMAGGTLVFYLR